MDVLILKESHKASSIMRQWSRTKFIFEWNFYRKLILKRCLNAKDWFRDKAVVQHKILFRMDFLLKVNSCPDAIFVSTVILRFRTKSRFKWTFKNGFNFDMLYYKIKVSAVYAYSLKTKNTICACTKRLMLLIFFKKISWFFTKYVVFTLQFISL